MAHGTEVWVVEVELTRVEHQITGYFHETTSLGACLEICLYLSAMWGWKKRKNNCIGSTGSNHETWFRCVATMLSSEYAG